MRRPLAHAREAGRYPLDINWNRLALPGLVLLAAGFLAPLLLLAVYSVFRDGANGQVIGTITLANYAAIVTDAFYLRVLGDTVLLGLSVTLACACLGYPLAYFLARTSSPWRPILVFLMITPLMVSSVIRNIGWIPVLGDHGALNTLLLTHRRRRAADRADEQSHRRRDRPRPCAAALYDAAADDGDPDHPGGHRERRPKPRRLALAVVLDGGVPAQQPRSRRRLRAGIHHRRQLLHHAHDPGRRPGPRHGDLHRAADPERDALCVRIGPDDRALRGGGRALHAWPRSASSRARHEADAGPVPAADRRHLYLPDGALPFRRHRLRRRFGDAVLPAPDPHLPLVRGDIAGSSSTPCG